MQVLKKLGLLKKKPSSAHLEGSVSTYTQVLEHSFKELQLGIPVKLLSLFKDGNKHGTNRDVVKMSLISPSIAVVCVCDGAGLLYWSQVAAFVACTEFISYMQDYFAQHSHTTSKEMHTVLKSALIHANKKAITYILPSGEKVHIMDKGGQTTLAAIVVLEDDNGQWNAISIGSGDSECHKLSKDGTWTCMFKNDGTMLPFSGLEEHNITDPVCTPCYPGDCLFCVSDGVSTSFMDKFPSLDLNNTCDEICQQLCTETYNSHKQLGADPDDVAIGVIKISPLANNDNNTQQTVVQQSYPRQVTCEDQTEKFFPEFSIRAQMPWGESVIGKKTS